MAEQPSHLTHHPSSVTIPCGSSRLIYRGRPLVMGILNITPDSFSDGGRCLTPSAAVRHGIEMVEHGADLLDIGGESTRPGALSVSEAEELRRILPVMAQLRRKVNVPLSIDTSKAEVARRALDAGASIVNDVTALRGDPRMAQVVARAKASVILMHMRGAPKTMQRSPRYRHVVNEVLSFLRRMIHRAQEEGIAASRLLIDPGLGFGKTLTHNLELLRQLRRVVELGYPVVIGPSRKSFIGQVVGAPVSDRLPGTLACVAAADQAGVHMVRVHDVRETVQFLTMLQSLEAE